MRKFIVAAILVVGCSGNSAAPGESPPSREFGRLQTLQGQPFADAAPISSNPAPKHRLELQLIDRGARPAAESFVTITNLATARAVFEGTVSGGRLEVELEEGQYGIGGVIATPRPGFERPSFTVACLPKLDFGGETQLVLDAQRGKRVVVSLDDPSAKQTLGAFFVSQPTARGAVQFPASPPRIDDLEKDEVYAAATSPEKGFAFNVQTYWTQGGASDSPYTYHLISSTADRIPDEPIYRVRKSDLVEVRAHWSAQGVPWKGDVASAGSTPSLDFVNVRGVWGFAAGVTFPGVRTDYYTPGAWQLASHQGTSGSEAESLYGGAEYARPGIERQEWGTMPLGPAFSAGNSYYLGPSRAGDDLSVIIPMYTDAEVGHVGDTTGTATGSTTLRRGEEIVAQTDSVGSLGRGVTLPPEKANYELTVQGTRKVPWSLYATEQTVSWRFSSQNTASREPLPLMVLRYSPKLDDHGRARAGLPSIFDVRVERNAAHVPLRELRVFVSYDDGQRWEPAEVIGRGDTRRVLVRYPADAEFVSLRGVAVDEKGHSVTQTLLRAYGLRPR